jgi:NAD(P)-binding Rossmann-like domain/Flavin containing amine oxidoreductase
MSADFDCIVVGAGLSGLTAARLLQSAGLSTLIIESSDRPGGRVKSDIIDGYTLDHGFQVINRGYPNIKRTGVLDELRFTPMVDGAIPFRVSGGVRRVSDLSTPFLRGVFLTEPRSVSTRVRFEIYKSFLQGRPGFVDGGVSAFSEALARPVTDIHYRETVHSMETGVVQTDHATYSAEHIVVATDAVTANQLVASLEVTPMNRSTTWYHVSNSRIEGAGRFTVSSLGLAINSFAISDRVPSYAPHGKQLFSSTTLHATSESEVRRELSKIWKADTSRWELIARYEIKKSLPVHRPGKSLYSQFEIEPGLFVIGDHRAYPSQQGAMESGRRVARVIIERALRAR